MQLGVRCYLGHSSDRLPSTIFTALYGRRHCSIFLMRAMYTPLPTQKLKPKAMTELYDCKAPKALRENERRHPGVLRLRRHSRAHPTQLPLLLAGGEAVTYWPARRLVYTLDQKLHLSLCVFLAIDRRGDLKMPFLVFISPDDADPPAAAVDIFRGGGGGGRPPPPPPLLSPRASPAPCWASILGGGGGGSCCPTGRLGGGGGARSVSGPGEDSIVATWRFMGGGVGRRGGPRGGAPGAPPPPRGIPFGSATGPAGGEGIGEVPGGARGGGVGSNGALVGEPTPSAPGPRGGGGGGAPPLSSPSMLMSESWRTVSSLRFAVDAGAHNKEATRTFGGFAKCGV